MTSLTFFSRVQQGYVLQLLGRTGEASKLYAQVLKSKPSDISLSAVASNNIITLNKVKHPGISIFSCAIYPTDDFPPLVLLCGRGCQFHKSIFSIFGAAHSLNQGAYYKVIPTCYQRDMKHTCNEFAMKYTWISKSQY